MAKQRTPSSDGIARPATAGALFRAAGVASNMLDIDLLVCHVPLRLLRHAEAILRKQGLAIVQPIRTCS